MGNSRNAAVFRRTKRRASRCHLLAYKAPAPATASMPSRGQQRCTDCQQIQGAGGVKVVDGSASTMACSAITTSNAGI